MATWAQPVPDQLGAEIEEFDAIIDSEQLDITTELEERTGRRRVRSRIDAAILRIRELVAAGRYGEADLEFQKALELVGDTDPSSWVRVILEWASAKIRQGDFARAQQLLDEASHAEDLTGKQQIRIGSLVNRLTASLDKTEQRQALEEVRQLQGDFAIDRARQLASDPTNLSARYLLAGLLHQAGNAQEAANIYLGLISDSQTESKPEVRQRSLGRLLRLELQRGNITRAREYLSALERTADSPLKADQIDDARQRLAAALTRAEKLRLAEAEAERKAEIARLRAEIAEADGLPPRQKIVRLEALYRDNPDSEDAGVALARAHASHGRWKQADQIYRQVIGGDPSTLPPPLLLERSGPVFGLVDLYSRTNRLREAGRLLSMLDQASQTAGKPLPDRGQVLNERLERALSRHQFSGSATATAGYDSNVAASESIIDDETVIGGSGGPSTLGGFDARGTYSYLIGANGDRLTLFGRLNAVRYFDEGSLDRQLTDISAGYLHVIPGTTNEVGAGGGYRTRFIDSDAYRSDAYAFLSFSGGFRRDFDYGAAFIVEQKSDDDPDLEGYGLEARLDAAYEIVEDLSLRSRFIAKRYEVEERSDSKTEFAINLGLRKVFAIGGWDEFYAGASYALGYSEHDASAAPGIPPRSDVTHRLEAAIGRDFADGWRAEASASYRVRRSNIEALDDETLRLFFSVTRYLSYP